MSRRGAEGDSKRKREWERKGQRQRPGKKYRHLERVTETQTQRDKTTAE